MQSTNSRVKVKVPHPHLLYKCSCNNCARCSLMKYNLFITCIHCGFVWNNLMAIPLVFSETFIEIHDLCSKDKTLPNNVECAYNVFEVCFFFKYIKILYFLYCKGYTKSMSKDSPTFSSVFSTFSVLGRFQTITVVLQNC